MTLPVCFIVLLCIIVLESLLDCVPNRSRESLFSLSLIVARALWLTPISRAFVGVLGLIPRSCWCARGVAYGVFALRFWVELVNHVDAVIARCATSDTSRVFDPPSFDELFNSSPVVQEAYLEEVKSAARSEVECPASVRVCSVSLRTGILRPGSKPLFVD